MPKELVWVILGIGILILILVVPNQLEYKKESDNCNKLGGTLIKKGADFVCVEEPRN